MRRLALLALAWALAAGPAGAHAQLVHSEPAAGAVLATAPAEVVLTFTEPVSPLVFRWLGPDGSVRDLVPRVETTRVVVPVPPTVAGSQLLSWRVASADGHPVGGAFSLAIGAPSATPAAGPVPPTAVVAAAARGLLSLLLAIGVGGALFTSLVDPGARAPARSRALARAAAIATLPAAALALATHGFDLLGSFRPPLATLAPEALASPFARTAGLAALAGLLALGRARNAILAAWAAAALSFAASGHAAAASPAWLTLPAMALHAAALIFWLGALPPLAAWAASRRPGLAPALAGFSALALPLVGLLVASGAILAIVELGRPAALIDTAYGRLLCLKLVAVAAMLALAALNRLRLTPRLASRALARSATAELMLGVLALGLATGFRLTPPPRELALAAAAPVEVDLQGSGIMAMLTLDPGRPGANGIAIDLMGIAPTGVTLALSLPEKGIEPIRLPATADASGIWHAGPFLLPLAAPWTATLQIRVGDFDETTLSGTVPVGP